MEMAGLPEDRRSNVDVTVVGAHVNGGQEALDAFVNGIPEPLRQRGGKEQVSKTIHACMLHARKCFLRFELRGLGRDKGREKLCVGGVQRGESKRAPSVSVCNELGVMRVAAAHT